VGPITAGGDAEDWDTGLRGTSVIPWATVLLARLDQRCGHSSDDLYDERARSTTRGLRRRRPGRSTPAAGI